MKIISKNKKAYHDYKILKEFEAGIALKGSEVKSIRKGEVNLKGSYATINQRGMPILIDMHIKPYLEASYENCEAKRSRLLLLNKQEIKKIVGEFKSKGVTLIPLDIHFSGQWIKIKLGLCIGKKDYDKRQTLKEKDTRREMEKYVKRNI